ncbi:hypothetical protein SCLCIDRAFT_25993 [Scleroderma citrinum Foug A]|uniref:Uncharacterized protein n=1 Tax=Scleroderma citrinum Foug A TaxID=1036808 RepID=A0A0C3DKY9_9AGAM|nr:hypothetical protein SCLCIDRAFT_25993 [Scleroderma citrinum Foug A]
MSITAITSTDPHPNSPKDDWSTHSAQDLDSVPPWYEYVAVTNAAVFNIF